MSAYSLFAGRPEVGKRLLDALGQKFTLKSELAENRNLIFLDTFDWRLYKAGFLLKFCHKTYLLQRLEGQNPVAVMTVSSGSPQRFFWEFPEGELKQILAATINVRALLPIISLKETIQPLRLLNREEKTLVKLELSTLTAPPDHVALMLSINPLRGYDKAARRVKKIVQGIEGLQPATSVFDVMQTIGNLQPASYSNKIDVILEPESPADEATRKILLSLVATMHANERGIVEDIDSEFLHDFRVAIRRTRAALGQIKEVFPATQTEYFRNVFAELGSQTNLLRDLDVYLLHQDQFYQLLPPDLQPGLIAFFLKLKRKRRTAVSQVRQLLHSAKYRRQLEEWESFLRAPREKTPMAANAEKPIIELASLFIYRRFHQIVKAGNRITLRSPDKELHKLRINGKKLRYLLEFFASLYPPGEMKRLISQLKKLQDNLGEFNDLSVQQDYLHRYLETLNNDSQGGMLTAAAIGALLGHLHERQQQVRDDFAGTFSRFNTPEMQTTYQQLFASRRSS